jgi:lipoteichoic acid synthase
LGNSLKKVDYFIAFTMLFIIKFLMFRYFLYKDFNLVKVILFELTPFLLLMVIIEVSLNKSRLWVYTILNLILSGFLFSIVLYSSYFGTLPSYHDLTQLNQVGSVTSSILLLLRPVHFIFFLDLIIILPLFIWKFETFNKRKTFNRGILSIIFIISGFSLITNLVQAKDDIITDPASFAYNNGLISYQILEVYQSESKEIVKDIHYTTEDVMKLKGSTRINDTLEYFGAAKGRNLILIQIESMQNFLINLEIDGVEITPNINNLLRESIYFSNVYQQIGAGNTSDAEFLVNTSLYPAGKQATSKAYADKEFPSLPKVMKKHNYITTTFHADHITYWNRHELYPSLGFDKVYDLSYFGEEDVIGFGPSDEVLFDKTIEALAEMEEKQQKFYAHVLSLTSHTPFVMPEDKVYIELPKKYKNTLVGNYLLSMNYTDRALGDFIEDLKKKGIWQNSVIAIYGDHSGLHGRLLQEEDNKLMRDILGYGYPIVDRFNMPFIIDIPGVTKGTRIERLGGQIDIMPTLSNLLGISLKDHIIFGQDLLNYENNLIGMRYYLSTGSYFDEDVLFLPTTSQRKSRTYDLVTKQLTERKEDFNDKYKRMIKIYEMADNYLKSLPSK